MAKSWQGNPCWYELLTRKSDMQAAESFYGKVFGWTFKDSGMPGFDYHLASSGGDSVAGVTVLPEDPVSGTPYWITYFAVDDADQTVAAARAAGATILREPSDVPGTGRFALIADLQGAGFGILQPDMSAMSAADVAKAEAGAGAFDQNKPGHGNWHELMSSDRAAAFSFYSALFGWTKGRAIDMGPLGTYQIFRRGDLDIGGMLGLGETPTSAWLPYFGVGESVPGLVATIRAAGGAVDRDPQEVPGGAFAVAACDPQGAWFALVGMKE